MIDRSVLLEAWPFLGSFQLHPLRQGANNAVSLVACATGERYILRLTRQVEIEHLLYEIAVVNRLQHAGLPFDVPAPFPTDNGEALVTLADESENIAVLWPFVAGAHSTGNNLRQAAAAGRALARLQQALARVHPPGSPRFRPRQPAGELHSAHPSTADPVAAIEGIPIDQQSKRHTLAILHTVIENIPGVYANLPRQLIHNDFDPSNVLLLGSRVSGVLDWEFSTLDLRAMDLAVALLWWPFAPLACQRRWEIMDAFGQGYMYQQPLTAGEIEALPFLIRLRTMATLLFRIGRYHDGRDPEPRAVQRVQWTLEVNDWLDASTAELRRHAHQWAASRGGRAAGNR